MSVIDVTIKQEEISIADGIRSGTRTYQVRCDDVADDADSALTATGVAAIGDAWKAGSNALCTSKRAARTDDQFTYEVSCEYSSKQELQDLSVENPLARPAKYTYGGSNTTERFFRDADDKPVVNSAGEDFADLPERNRGEGTITITRNESTFDDAAMEAYKNKINDAAVTIRGVSYPTGTLRIDSISASGPNVENDITFWEVTYVIAKKIDGWNLKIEDRGLNYLVSGKPKPIPDKDGNPVVLPYPLDGAGGMKTNITDTPAQLTFKPYATVSFTGPAL